MSNFLSIFLRILSLSFGTKFSWNKESALLLVKSPNLYKEYARHGAAHIRRLPIRAYIQVFGDTFKRCMGGSPLSKYINIVELSSKWLSARNSCKYRHYESFWKSILIGSCICYTLDSSCPFVRGGNVAR